MGSHYRAQTLQAELKTKPRHATKRRARKRRGPNPLNYKYKRFLANTIESAMKPAEAWEGKAEEEVKPFSYF